MFLWFVSQFWTDRLKVFLTSTFSIRIRIVFQVGLYINFKILRNLILPCDIMNKISLSITIMTHEHKPFTNINTIFFYRFQKIINSNPKFIAGSKSKTPHFICFQVLCNGVLDILPYLKNVFFQTLKTVVL